MLLKGPFLTYGRRCTRFENRPSFWEPAFRKELLLSSPSPLFFYFERHLMVLLGHIISEELRVSGCFETLILDPAIDDESPSLQVAGCVKHTAAPKMLLMTLFNYSTRSLRVQVNGQQSLGTSTVTVSLWALQPLFRHSVQSSVYLDS